MSYFDDVLRDDYCDGPDFCSVNNPEIIFTMTKSTYIDRKLVRLCIRYEHVGDSKEKLFGVIDNAVGLIKNGVKFWRDGKRRDYGENLTFDEHVSTGKYLTFPLNNFNHPDIWKKIINSGVQVQGDKTFSSVILEFTKSNEFLGLNEGEKDAVNRIMKQIVEIENETEIADVPTKLLVNLNSLENIPSLNELNH